MAEQQREQHLYLLFDDWNLGYSIRKLRLSRRAGKRRSSSDSGKQVVEPVPEVFMRIQAPRGFPDMFTSAFGTKIMSMHPAMHLGMFDERWGIPMIDVQEQALIYGPPPGNYNACPIYFPVGNNKLFVLDIGTMELYLWTPEHAEQPWQCQDLPEPPFKMTDVSSYGVQPDGCILLSTTKSTFIFDTTKEKDYVWKPYGNWVLPFTGRGHYDTSLEGLVGLSKDPDTHGYLYSTSSTATGRLNNDKTLHPCPDFKRTKEKVSNNNPAEEGYVSATLVHMRKGQFCLVECVSIDKTGQQLSVSWVDDFKVPLGASSGDFVGGGPQGGHFMYRIKTFSLSYDPEEDCLKLNHRKVRCFNLPHDARVGTICMDPVAFWL